MNLLPQGHQWQLPPCQTFAEDMAARNPTAPTANDVKNAASALTDTFGVTGDLGADLARSLGRESTSLETLGRTGAYAGLLFTAYDAGHAYHTGRSEDIFDAGYGTVALVAGAFVPPFGAGMAIAKVGSSLITPSESNILEQAAQPRCQPVN